MHEPCATPTDNDSPTCELSVSHFGTGTCEEYLKFRANFDEVCKGQHIAAGPGQHALARCLLVWDSLTMFDNHTDALASEMVDNCKQCLDTTCTSIFLHCAAAVQKQCMRRFMQKPHDMTTHEWLACVHKINNYFPHFPESGVPQQLIEFTCTLFSFSIFFDVVFHNHVFLT